nr:MAG TPA: hypothetical protein [Bacteriophage sp.]
MNKFLNADLFMEYPENYIRGEKISNIVPNNPYYVEHSIYFAESLSVFEDISKTKRLVLGLDYEYNILDSIASEQSNKDCYRAILFLKSFSHVYIDYHSYGDLVTAEVLNKILNNVDNVLQVSEDVSSKVVVLSKKMTEHISETTAHAATESVVNNSIALRTDSGTLKASAAQNDDDLTTFAQTKTQITDAKSEMSAKLKEAKDELTHQFNTKIEDLIDNAPDALNTLKELADALTENKDGITAINAALANRYTKQETDERVDTLISTIHVAGQGDISDQNIKIGLGLTKTVNGIPSMQECQKNEPWSASPNWVFNLLMGTTQQDVNNQVSKALQDRVKSDNNIFCFRGTILVDDIDSATKNGVYFVRYTGYSGCLLVFTPYGSSGVIQFYKAGYLGTTPWKYRNAIDSNTGLWTEWKTFLSQDNFKLTGTTLEITL